MLSDPYLTGPVTDEAGGSVPPVGLPARRVGFSATSLPPASDSTSRSAHGTDRACGS
jgi:hypothetical protein